MAVVIHEAVTVAEEIHSGAMGQTLKRSDMRDVPNFSGSCSPRRTDRGWLAQFLSFSVADIQKELPILYHSLWGARQLIRVL